MADDPIRLRYNQDLATAVIGKSGIHSRYPSVREQVATLVLHTENLKPFGYNPSIIEFDGKLMMLYRYHEGTPATKLAGAIIGDAGHVLASTELIQNAKSQEDPKLFRIGESICFSCVQSTFPVVPLRSTVWYGEFVSAPSEMVQITPKLPRNDGSAMQKNWVFWSNHDKIYCLFRCHPTQQIYELDGERPKQLYETEGPRWPYGIIRGDTAPLEYEGKLLRFFHSALDNDPGIRRRYFIGCCLMEPKPPFKTVRVSKKPILYGSEVCDVKRKDCAHFKPGVVFGGGAIARSDSWLLSIGINDCQAAIAHLFPKDLHL